MSLAIYHFEHALRLQSRLNSLHNESFTVAHQQIIFHTEALNLYTLALHVKA